MTGLRPPPNWRLFVDLRWVLLKAAWGGLMGLALAGVIILAPFLYASKGCVELADRLKEQIKIKENEHQQ